MAAAALSAAPTHWPRILRADRGVTPRPRLPRPLRRAPPSHRPALALSDIELSLRRRRGALQGVSLDGRGAARSARSSARTAPARVARQHHQRRSTAPIAGSIADRRSSASPRVPTQRLAALGVARTFQNLALSRGLSVLDNVAIGLTHIPQRRPLARRSLGLPQRPRARTPRSRAAAPRSSLPRPRSISHRAGRHAALRPAEAGRARPRAGRASRASCSSTSRWPA